MKYFLCFYRTTLC